MHGSEIKPGERVKDVHFTEDTIAVDLMDGRTIVVRWHGIQLFWKRPRSSEQTGKSAVQDMAFTGPISTRISAAKGSYGAHRQLRNRSKSASSCPTKRWSPISRRLCKRRGMEWMAMIQSRNGSTHPYNEKTAKEVADAILSSFVGEFETFLVRFTELEAQES